MKQHPNKLGYFTKSYDLPSAVSTFRREEMILDSMGFFLSICLANLIILLNISNMFMH